MELLETIATLPIAGLLAKLENEAQQRIDATVLQILDGRSVAQIELPGHGPQTDRAICEVRVIVDSTFKASISRFACQAIMQGLAQGTGYSGFTLAGKVDNGVEPAEVRMRSQTN